MCSNTLTPTQWNPNFLHQLPTTIVWRRFKPRQQREACRSLWCAARGQTWLLAVTVILPNDDSLDHVGNHRRWSGRSPMNLHSMSGRPWLVLQPIWCEDMQLKADNLAKEITKTDLQVNIDKTEIMRLNHMLQIPITLGEKTTRWMSCDEEIH